jgi:hypothetical protein
MDGNQDDDHHFAGFDASVVKRPAERNCTDGRSRFGLAGIRSWPSSDFCLAACGLVKREPARQRALV